MFEKLAESSGNVVGFKAIGKLKASDFKALEPEVKALIEQDRIKKQYQYREGSIRLLFDMAEYKGETAKGWIADYKFGFEFHDQIDKMAIVGDKTWEEWVTHLAKYSHARNAKFFHSADIGKAWAWLRE